MTDQGRAQAAPRPPKVGGRQIRGMTAAAVAYLLRIHHSGKSATVISPSKPADHADDRGYSDQGQRQLTAAGTVGGVR